MIEVVIITPVLDRKYLQNSMKSVLANSCDLIIVNDSNKPLELKEKGVYILNNTRNRGIGISRNRGVQFALKKGYEYIGFVDADSVLSENWREELESVLQSPEVIGVSGLALNPDQKSRIARIKFLYKTYGRRHKIPFQIDCSLFHREAFSNASFGTRRFGEDAYFLNQINQQKLRVSPKAVSFHYETERIHVYLKKELLGALYSESHSNRIIKSFLLTPWTMIKMAKLRSTDSDYSVAALFWIFRQLLWFSAFIIGRMTNFGHSHLT